jgi:WD40 repeat protein
MSNQKKVSRYPGTRPFEPAEQRLFYGREREINDLTRMTILERLVVLFGKSGYGKSSLLQAGVLPRLSEHEEIWSPLSVRLGVYNGQFSPCQIVLEQLKRVEKVENTEGSFLEDGNLWRSFKKRQNPERERILLIFDQFEEFFTYPLAQQKEFKTQIAELMFSSMPQQIVENYKSAPVEQRRFLARAMNIHVLISIRSDKLSLLHSLKDALPAILHVRYELQGLNIDQARQAIQQPAIADRPEANFTAPPYDFEPEALDFMVQKLSERTSEVLMEPQIEAFQLQIVCQEIEDKVISSGKKIITKADLPSFEAVYEDYYKTQIDKITDPTIQKVARIILEEKLISGNLDNNSARREPMSGSKLMEEAAATQELLDNLVNFRLLRREPNSLGGDSYEISHDTLIAPVLKSKNIRLATEREEASVLSAITYRKEAEERMEAQQKRRRKRIAIAALITGLAIGSLYLWTNVQKDKNINKRIAQITNSLINDKPFEALQMAYNNYNSDKTPLASVTFCNTFFNFLKSTDGLIYEEIGFADIIESASFTENDAEIKVNYSSDLGSKADSFIYNLKTHKSHAFTNQKVLPMAKTDDSLMAFGGKLKVVLRPKGEMHISDKRRNFAENHDIFTEYAENISFSRTGNRLMTVHKYERKIRIWYFQDKNIFIFGNGNTFNQSANFSPDSVQNLLTTNNSSAFLWTNRGNLVKILRGPSEINDAIFSADGRYIITASRDFFLRVIDRNSFKIIDSLKLDEKPLSIYANKNAPMVLINKHETDSEIYGFENDKLGKKIKTLTGFRNATFDLKNTSIIGLKDSLVTTFDLKTDKIETLAIPNRDIYTVRMSTEKKQILLLTGGGDVYISDGKKRVIHLETNEVFNAILSENGEFIATTSPDAVQVWNSKGDLIMEWHTKDGFMAVAFSPDNLSVAATAFDGSIYILPLPENIYNWLKINDFPMNNN